MLTNAANTVRKITTTRQKVPLNVEKYKIKLFITNEA